MHKRHARYKDDVYDRIWLCDQFLYENNDWYPLGLDESINMDPEINNDAYKLPSKLLRSTAQPNNVSHPLGFIYEYTYSPPLDKTY